MKFIKPEMKGEKARKKTAGGRLLLFFERRYEAREYPVETNFQWKPVKTTKKSCLKVPKISQQKCIMLKRHSSIDMQICKLKLKIVLQLWK